jgi:Leucine-rich repeat (LRR) protein
LKNSYTTWEDFWEEGQLVSRIVEIRYDNKSIIKIPNSIADLDSLKWLELQNNNIYTIPGYIGSLEVLEYFTIFQNEITELPPQIGNLASLEVLKVSENKLENIHPNIGKLDKLNQLWLSENQLTILPDGMCDILGNININIYIDNNLLCINANNDCFLDLINNSVQQSDCDD